MSYLNRKKLMATIVVSSAAWSSKGKILEATEELRNMISSKLQKILDEGAGEALADPAKALLALVKTKVNDVVRNAKDDYPVAALVTKDLSVQLVVDEGEPLSVYTKDGMLSVGSISGSFGGYGGYTTYPRYRHRTFPAIPADEEDVASAAASAAAFKDAWDEMNDRELWGHYYQ